MYVSTGDEMFLEANFKARCVRQLLKPLGMPQNIIV